ncbi:hypothetical protein PAMP_022798 [Pampus punctatissimus]
MRNRWRTTWRSMTRPSIRNRVVLRNFGDASEPAALAHKCCTDRGFSDMPIITYMWAIRLQKLAGISNNLVKQKSALYTLGTEIVCKPTAHNTHQVHTVNQYCDSVVIPETLESPGVYMPNLYMKYVRGGDVHINTGGPFDMVVADAFNGFCPKKKMNFFTFLYMHPMEQENNLSLIRKKEEVELDIAINTISRSITSLDANIALLKESTTTTVREENEYNKFKKELCSTEMQRADLRYLLGALRGRLDVQRLMGAVKILSDNVGVQLDAFAYINRQVLGLAVQRDLKDSREPVTRVTVQV